jgi:MFS family permease
MSSEQPPVIISGRPVPGSLREARVALAGLSAVFLFEMLDNSILNVALPTIGSELHASTLSLEWVTGVYAVVFGGLMLAFGAIADRFGRRRIMLIGLVLLATASLATAFVTTSDELIVVRAVMGIAAAMTTPGSIALAFRLFEGDTLRVRAMTLISTVGLVGLAIGPTAGGLVLAIAPWQVLLLINVPIAILAFVGIRVGIARDDPSELHRDPIDIVGAVLGTGTIVLALFTPTLFVNEGTESWAPWAAAVVTVAAAIAFVLRERAATHPLLDLKLIGRPLVSSGLAYKAATGLAVAGMGYMVTLQLQLDWGWPPYLASIGMLPQVVVLIFGGPLANRFIERVGLDRAAWLSAASVVAGLAVFGLLSSFGYVWIAIALVLVAAGIRVNGVVAGTNVLKGLPANRTSIGAALVDTASEVATAVGIAVSGTVLAAVFTGSVAKPNWTAAQTSQFETGILIAGVTLTVVAAALVAFGFVRSRLTAGPTDTAVPEGSS